MIATQTNRRPPVRTSIVRFLLRKELAEGRLLVLWTAALMAAVLVLYASLTLLTGGEDGTKLDPQSSEVPLVLMFFVSAGLASSSMVSPEIGGGNLEFLTTLPVSRNTVWWTKVGSALLVHILSLIAITAVYYLFLLVVSSAGLFYRDPHIILNDTRSQQLWCVPLLTFGAFGVGTVMTMFADRTLTAVLTTSIIVIAASASFASLGSTLEKGHQWVVPALIGLLSVIALGVSRTLFVHGETLRTSKRFTILLDIGIWDFLPIVVAVIIALVWLMY
jgi:hypothetical protein